MAKTHCSAGCLVRMTVNLIRMHRAVPVVLARVKRILVPVRAMDLVQGAVSAAAAQRVAARLPRIA